jgi:hypothetical protein
LVKLAGKEDPVELNTFGKSSLIPDEDTAELLYVLYKIIGDIVSGDFENHR